MGEGIREDARPCRRRAERTAPPRYTPPAVIYVKRVAVNATRQVHSTVLRPSVAFRPPLRNTKQHRAGAVRRAPKPPCARAWRTPINTRAERHTTPAIRRDACTRDTTPVRRLTLLTAASPHCQYTATGDGRAFRVAPERACHDLTLARPRRAKESTKSNEIYMSTVTGAPPAAHRSQTCLRMRSRDRTPTR